MMCFISPCKEYWFLFWFFNINAMHRQSSSRYLLRLSMFARCPYQLKVTHKKKRYRIHTVLDRNCVKLSLLPARFENDSRLYKRCEVKTEQLAVSCEHDKMLFFRPASVPNLPYLKTITLVSVLFSLFYLKSFKFKWTFANVSANFNGYA